MNLLLYALINPLCSWMNRVTKNNFLPFMNAWNIKKIESNLNEF